MGRAHAVVDVRCHGSVRDRCLPRLSPPAEAPDPGWPIIGHMKLTSFTAIVSALQDAGVRYLVAGGLAVNAHGYLRFTKDVDIVVQLVPENIECAFAALAAADYRPSVPIAATQFANVEMRDGWIRDKNMQVLQFWSDA